MLSGFSITSPSHLNLIVLFLNSENVSLGILFDAANIQQHRRKSVVSVSENTTCNYFQMYMIKIDMPIKAKQNYWLLFYFFWICSNGPTI